MIKDSILDEIRNKADIVSVVGDYVALRKRGRNYLALCPFHSEKTPSFTVSQEKQLFHCFGCGEGGNVFTFVMKHENVSFVEAAKILADKLGIAFDAPVAGHGQVPSETQKLYDILEEAAKFYEHELRRSASAVDYAKKRGLTKNAVISFRIGYSPEGWDGLYKHLAGKGFHPKDIERAGLIIPREGQSTYYDRFRNRLMFTITDIKGRPIGFGARSMDGSEPKYLNSPDSPVYNKSNVLFGLYQAKEAVRAKKQALIMEGYMDVVASHTAGFENSVASSGTSLTINQMKALQRLTSEFVLVFDADSAGSAASDKSIDMLREIGIYPKVALLHGGKDPDEVIKNKGKEHFASLIADAVPWLRFKLEKAVSAVNLNEVESRAKAARDCAAILALVSDHVIRNEYAKTFAGRLNVDQETLLAEIKRHSYYGRNRTGRRDEPIKKPDSKVAKAERTVIRLSLESKEALDRTLSEISADDLTDDVRKRIFSAMAGLTEDDFVNSAVFDRMEDEEAQRALSEIIIDDTDILDKEKTLQDCINVIKGNMLARKSLELRRRISEAEKNNDLAALAELQKEYKQHHEQIRGF